MNLIINVVCVVCVVCKWHSKRAYDGIGFGACDKCHGPMVPDIKGDK